MFNLCCRQSKLPLVTNACCFIISTIIYLFACCCFLFVCFTLSVCFSLFLLACLCLFICLFVFVCLLSYLFVSLVFCICLLVCFLICLSTHSLQNTHQFSVIIDIAFLHRVENIRQGLTFMVFLAVKLARHMVSLIPQPIRTKGLHGARILYGFTWKTPKNTFQVSRFYKLMACKGKQ